MFIIIIKMISTLMVTLAPSNDIFIRVLCRLQKEDPWFLTQEHKVIWFQNHIIYYEYEKSFLMTNNSFF